MTWNQGDQKAKNMLFSETKQRYRLTAVKANSAVWFRWKSLFFDFSSLEFYLHLPTRFAGECKSSDNYSLERTLRVAHLERYVQGALKVRAVILITLMTPLFTYAQDSINCHFYRFHQANHTAPEMTGYAAIDQALTVTSGETSEATLKLDGKKRAANSTSWILLKPNGWETSSSTYAGNFGELLTISNLSNENTKNSNTWTNASLVRSNIDTTHTLIGKCIVK